MTEPKEQKVAFNLLQRLISTGIVIYAVFKVEIIWWIIILAHDKSFNRSISATSRLGNYYPVKEHSKPAIQVFSVLLSKYLQRNTNTGIIAVSKI